MFALADFGSPPADPHAVPPCIDAGTALPGAGRLAPRKGMRSVHAWAAALAAGLALTLAVMPAQAQTSVTLVSNHGQSSAWFSIDDSDHRTQFTTGSHADGYRLTGVTVDLNQITTSTVAFNVAVGGSSLSDTALTSPASLTNGNNTFTASGNGIDLAANTTYYVWLEVTAQGNGQGFINRTTSDDEDSGAAAGWSIANNGEYRDWNLADWSSTSGLLKFAIKGYAKAPPGPGAPGTPMVSAVSNRGDRLSVSWTAPTDNRGSAVTDYDLRYYQGSADPTDPADWIEEGETGGHTHTGTGRTATVTGLVQNTAYRVQVRGRNANGAGAWSASASATTASWPAGTSVSLAGNLGKADSGTAGPLANVDFAQGFTTGSHAHGYVLDAVVLNFATAPSGLTVRLATGVSGTSRGAAVATLANPVTLAAGELRFTAPASTTLSAGTQYFVVVESSTFTGRLKLTASKTEDAGAAAGWSIADEIRIRPARSIGLFNTTSTAAVLKMRVDGYAVIPPGPAAPGTPTVSAVTDTGDRLSVSWTAPADTRGSAVTDYDLRYYQGSADPADPADWIEEGEAGGHTQTGAGTSALVTELLPNTAYRVQVRARNANGAGVWSASGSATTALSPAQASASSSLVSNTGQAHASGATLSVDFAAGFTTGGNATGYVLTSVDILFAAVGPVQSYSVSIRSSSGGNPGASLGELTNPVSLSENTSNTFTASGGGIALAADTAYFLVIDVAAQTSVPVNIVRTSSNAEDSGSAAGWSIADNHRTRTFNSAGSWSTPENDSLQFAVDGYARSVLPSLVSNLGTGGSSSSLAIGDYAQGFTTGSNAGGYALDAVVLNFETAPSGLTVQLATGVSTTSAGTTVATLTNPTTLAIGDLRFTAPASTVLSASTEYFVVVQASVGFVTGTKSTAEDAGAAAGWSIADEAYVRAASSTGAFANRFTSSFIRMRVHGYAVPPGPAAPGTPTVQAVTDTGDLLSVSWTAPADTRGSAVTGFDLRYYAGSADPADPADWIEEGEAGGHTHTGTATSAAVSGLLPNTAYRVQVRARNANGTGAWSASGSATTASWPAQASVTLVSNLGKHNFGTPHPLNSLDAAQGFTTGSNGYVLDAVVLNFASAPSGLTVHLATGVSTTSAGTTVATLTNPTALAAGDLRFTAAADTTLSAGTQYWVVVQGSGGRVRRTASKDEDAGAAAGWSVADEAYYRLASSTGAFPTAATTSVLKMRVDGYAVPSGPGAPGTPTVQAVASTGDRLSASWSAPAYTRGSAVTDYDLRYYQGSADPADPADWIEEDEAGGHNHAGTLRAAIVTGLLANADYRVQVRARNANGAGPWSASGSATTASWPSTSVSLVSNLGKANHSSSVGLAGFDLAQGFTTGSNANGYVLDAVVLNFETAPLALTVQLATGVSTSSAGTTVATLTNPSSLAAGDLRFTAPAGTTLSAGTQYFVVVQAGIGDVRGTPSKSETAAAGWSIADEVSLRASSDTGGFLPPSNVALLKMRVDGYARSLPAATSLVSNTGLADVTASNPAFTHDYAVAFTTGGTAAVLTSVEIAFKGALLSATSSSYSVSIRSDSAGAPGASVGALTNPASLSAGVNSFTASGGGISLAADTTYFVMIDVIAQHAQTSLSFTSSDAEDTGAAAGWSIADATLWRNRDSTGSWATNSNSLRFSVHGHAAPPPPRRDLPGEQSREGEFRLFKRP